MKSFVLVVGLALGAWQGTSGAQERAAQEKPAKPSVYDEKADARADLKAALARAQKENKRVLVQWGANWCGWCIKLHDVFKSDKEIADRSRFTPAHSRVLLARALAKLGKLLSGAAL